MNITDRMETALAALDARTAGRRKPSAFYLGPDDWADFMATEPPTIEAEWNRQPSQEPGFRDVPVRASKNVAPRQSRLYDDSRQGRAL